MRTTIEIFGVKYTKTSFDAKWKSIVNTNEANIFIKGETEKFLREVLSRTKRWATSSQRTTTRFKIRCRKFEGKAVRGVTMIDGTKEIWVGKGQLLEILFPKAKTTCVEKDNKKKALVAMRQIVEPQIKSFRASVLRQLERKPLRCKISHNFIEKGKFHIDHKYPFKGLVEDWCREYKVDLELIDIYCKGTKCYFRDIHLAESWFDYHLTNAHLQAVDVVVNLKKGSKYYG